MAIQRASTLRVNWSQDLGLLSDPGWVPLELAVGIALWRFARPKEFYCKENPSLSNQGEEL